MEFLKYKTVWILILVLFIVLFLFRSRSFHKAVPNKNYSIGKLKHTVPLLKFESKDGVYMTKESDLEYLLQMYKRVRKIFKRCGIKYYALAGSLLGAVRHKGIIPWDDDIDIGISVNDISKLKCVSKILQAYGYSMKKVYFGYKIYNTKSWYNYPFIDVYITAKGQYTPAAKIMFPKESFPPEYERNIIEIPFEDTKIPVFRNSEEYLKQVFGNNCLEYVPHEPWYKDLSHRVLFHAYVTP